MFVAESLGSPSIVHILDISDPTDPVPIGSYPGPWPVTNIAALGNYLYVDNLQGIYIVDISSPSNPTSLSFYQLYSTREAHIIDSYMYLAAGEGLLILDLSDPVRPTIAGRGVLQWSGAYLTVVGPYVYMTDENVWGWPIKYAGGLAIFETHELTRRANLPIVFR